MPPLILKKNCHNSKKLWQFFCKKENLFQICGIKVKLQLNIKVG